MARIAAFAALSASCSSSSHGSHGGPDAGGAGDGDGDGEGPGHADGGRTDERDAGGSARTCKHYEASRQAFFGDLHAHTALSLDANLQGTRLRPTDAYRFARGETLGISPYDADGKAMRQLALSRPLDFVALSDHAEFLGLVTTCLTPGTPGYDSSECDQYRSDPDTAFLFLNAQLAASQQNAGYREPCTADNSYCGSAALSAWNEVKSAAQGANDDSDECAFTAFVAYEWSASPNTQNLHRNVIFRSQEVPKLPFTYFDGSQEEDLWDALEKDCLKAGKGCDVLTIPHNSNLSAGIMFEPVDGQGKPFDSDYAKRRASFEPLVEIFQHKGSSECMPQMGNDELCSFELLPYNTLSSVTLALAPDTLVPRDYVRDALAKGLQFQNSLGANPFSYGFVASTDTHMATPGATEETKFVGHGGAGNPARSSLPVGLPEKVWLNPGGLAVLWAEENSRASLFEAMRRREAYGTSGTRIQLRFFGGFDLPDKMCQGSDFVSQGYAHGVPMGGELTPGQSKSAPTFAVWALRDPGSKAEPGVPLQRVQIIKGWVDASGIHYAIHDIAGNADNGASVDPDTCERTSAGQDELCGTWTDPDYDPSEQAFYYARVLEDPSCRWQAIQCNAAGVTCGAFGASKSGFDACCDKNYPRVQQERAWSSPIFHRAP